ncbi:MAG: dihydrolipoyl dehydrogenase [Amaricoccus sp.]
MTERVDVAIIGAGTAGMAAYRAARAQTERVLLIEGARYGTTCARVGCMPSKLLIAAGDAAYMVAGAHRFGIDAGPAAVDGRRVMDRVRRERDRFVGFVVEAVEAWPAATRARGTARFADPHTLRLAGGPDVEADRIVIATGSEPVIPPAFAELGDRVVVNDDVFDWQDLPKSVAVVGTGVIGLELGQALARLGVRVRTFGRDGRIAMLTDPDVRAAASNALKDEIGLYGAAFLDAARDGDGVAVRSRQDGRELTETFDYLIAATGRRPAVAGLALENAGIALDDHGVPVFDRFTMQCGDSHVFVAGDASGDIPLLHEAADQGRIAGDNAGRFPDVRAGLRRTPLAVVFTDPNIATVGRTRRELDAAGIDFAVGGVDFADQGRSRVMLQNRGALRLYAEHGTGRLLGAEMVGPRAEHLAHLLAWAHQQMLTVPAMLDLPFYHPVIEEGVRTALREANALLHLGPKPVPRSLDCGPGA